jgi:RNA polymerase sigma-70 factor (ECF subfamily)
MNPAIHDREPDEELIRLVAAGDEAAFARLADRYQRAVFSTIRRYLGSSTDVEDLAQDVFASVWQNARRFEGRSRFSTWLYRIVVNRCLKHRRKHRIAVESLDELGEEAPEPEQLTVEFKPRLEQERKSRIVNRAISELPERQRMALILTRFEGKSYQEAREIMGVSLSAIESLVLRAKENLAKRLEPLRAQGAI